MARPGKRDECECVGFVNHGHCSHIVCAEIAARKSAECDGCGELRWWPQLRVGEEEDGLLSWYPGDVFCDTCLKAGVRA
ncbi:MAG: hypothetical protein M3315_06855 [Actinomycetota bacterium]|nr:hypothetical protein [Actinomycetota bacterium]